MSANVADVLAQRRRSRRRFASVEVEIDLADFEPDDLIAELESRGYAVARAGEAIDESIESGVSAYLSGRAEALREWARNFLQDRAYRCLP